VLIFIKVLPSHGRFDLYTTDFGYLGVDVL
jgi:hypothetical protein